MMTPIPLVAFCSYVLVSGYVLVGGYILGNVDAASEGVVCKYNTLMGFYASAMCVSRVSVSKGSARRLTLNVNRSSFRRGCYGKHSISAA